MALDQQPFLSRRLRRSTQHVSHQPVFTRETHYIEAIRVPHSEYSHAFSSASPIEPNQRDQRDWRPVSDYTLSPTSTLVQDEWPDGRRSSRSSIGQMGPHSNIVPTTQMRDLAEMIFTEIRGVTTSNTTASTAALPSIHNQNNISSQNCHKYHHKSFASRRKRGEREAERQQSCNHNSLAAMWDYNQIEVEPELQTKGYSTHHPDSFARRKEREPSLLQSSRPETEPETLQYQQYKRQQQRECAPLQDEKTVLHNKNSFSEKRRRLSHLRDRKVKARNHTQYQYAIHETKNSASGRGQSSANNTPYRKNGRSHSFKNSNVLLRSSDANSSRSFFVGRDDQQLGWHSFQSPSAMHRSQFHTFFPTPSPSPESDDEDDQSEQKEQRNSEELSQSLPFPSPPSSPLPQVPARNPARERKGESTHTSLKRRLEQQRLSLESSPLRAQQINVPEARRWNFHNRCSPYIRSDERSSEKLSQNIKIAAVSLMPVVPPLRLSSRSATAPTKTKWKRIHSNDSSSFRGDRDSLDITVGNSPIGSYDSSTRKRAHSPDMNSVERLGGKNGGYVREREQRHSRLRHDARKLHLEKRSISLFKDEEANDVDNIRDQRRGDKAAP